MRIIAESTLEKAISHYQSRGIESHLRSWISYMKRASYQSPNEIKKHYQSASIINDKRVVFNIKGNNFRLIVDIEYRLGIVFIVDVLTHSEYDKINVTATRYEDSKFYSK